MRMWVGDGKHFLAFPVRAGKLLNYVGFVNSDSAIRESWSARCDRMSDSDNWATGSW